MELAASGDIGDGYEFTKGVVIEAHSSEEISMLVVACSGPDVADLLGLDVLDGERDAGKGRSGQLEDRQRDRVVGERLGHPGNLWDKRRKTESERAALVVCSRRGGVDEVVDKAAQKSEAEETGVHGCRW